MAKYSGPGALMFKPVGDDDHAFPPTFRVVDERNVGWYRWRWWFLLISESAIRDQDIEDVRQDDERGRR